MAFKGLEEWAAKKRVEWLSHIKPKILALSMRKERVTLAEYEQLLMNGYERHELTPNLDNETLIHVTEYSLKNCGTEKRIPPACYDDAVIEVFAPLLIARLKEAIAAEEAKAVPHV